jgi:hypothetical protein
MKRRRDEYFFESLEQVVSLEKDARKQRDWKNYLAEIEHAEKYRKIVLAFPVWPVPLSVAAPPLSSVVAASLPLVQKLLLNVFPGLASLGP